MGYRTHSTTQEGKKGDKFYIVKHELHCYNIFQAKTRKLYESKVVLYDITIH